VRSFESLGKYPSFSNGGDEVGVAITARQHVQVKVFRDARTGRSTQIRPKINAVGMVCRLDGCDRFGGYAKQGGLFFGSETQHITTVSRW
jgi:hypothetical protein